MNSHKPHRFIFYVYYTSVHRGTKASLLSHSLLGFPFFGGGAIRPNWRRNPPEKDLWYWAHKYNLLDMRLLTTGLMNGPFQIWLLWNSCVHPSNAAAGEDEFSYLLLVSLMFIDVSSSQLPWIQFNLQNSCLPHLWFHQMTLLLIQVVMIACKVIVKSNVSAFLWEDERTSDECRDMNSEAGIRRGDVRLHV